MKFAAFIVFVFACSTTTAWSRSIAGDSTCVCTRQYDPVCGDDGETYGNRCTARCAGVFPRCKGECPCSPPKNPIETCACTGTHNTVCGSDGHMYLSPCFANCAGVLVQCEGECPCPEYMICPAVYRPVCGHNGITYSNSCGLTREEINCAGRCPCPPPEDPIETCACTGNAKTVCGSDGHMYLSPCFAKCAGVSVACEGECPCPEPVFCPAVYQPVCGYDGRTYGNSCEAGGALIKCEGECPCKDD